MHLHSVGSTAANNNRTNTMLRRVSGFLLLMAASVSAQMLGVPASVTSIGRGVMDPNLHTGRGPGSAILTASGFQNNCHAGVPRRHVVTTQPGLAGDYDGDRFHHRGPSVVYLYYPYAVPNMPASSPTDTSQQQDAAHQAGYEQEKMAAEVQRLQQEIADLKAAQSATTERQSPPSPATEANYGTEDIVAVLVLRDGRRVHLRNYAISGQEVWNFMLDHTEQIPMTNIDLAETTRVNRELGIALTSLLEKP